MPLPKDFWKWAEKNRESSSYERAFEKLDKQCEKFQKVQTDPEFLKNSNYLKAFLTHHVLVNCYFAKVYKEEKDPSKLKRNKYDGTFSKTVDSQLKKINDLRTFIRNYLEESDGVSKRTLLGLEKVWSIEHNEGLYPPNLNFIDDFLNCLSKGLQNPIMGMKNFPHLHRRWYGALLYPEDQLLDQHTQRHEDIALSSLAFRLTALFRFCSSGFEEPMAMNRPMPKFGKPCYRLVADFVNATFDTTKGEEEIKKNVLRLQKKCVHIYYWNE